MNEIELMDLITILNAAKLRGVSHQAIYSLVKRGKLSVVEIDGVKFVKRSEIVNYKRGKSGKKPKNKEEKICLKQKKLPKKRLNKEEKIENLSTEPIGEEK